MCPLFRLLIPVFALASGFATGGMAVGGETLTVFAAASLTEAITEAGRKFEQSQGVAVQFSFAASSTLARQIEAGAPAGLVALASEDWADYLADHYAAKTFGSRISAVASPCCAASAIHINAAVLSRSTPRPVA